MSMGTAPENLFQILGRDVTARITRLQEGVLGNRGPAAQAMATAELAGLRGCDPADPVAVPSMWATVQSDTPPEISHVPAGGQVDDPTPAERARHCALVLFANHQQSQRASMHRAGVPFAQAMRGLRSQRPDAHEVDPGALRRFQQVVLSPTWRGRSTHLLALVQMMRADGHCFDYGGLARDLLALSSPTLASGVRVRWGRQLYQSPTPPADNTGATQTSRPGAFS